MTIETNHVELAYQQALKDLFEEQRKDHLGVLGSVSEKAFERFSQTGLPDRKTEDYKYFHVQRSFPEKPVIQESRAQAGENLFITSRMEGQDAIQLVFIDGIFSEEHSSQDISESGLEIKHLSRLSENEIREDIHQYLEPYNVNNDPFIDLNTAFLRQGIIIKVNNHSQPLPVYCYYLTSSGEADSFRNFRTIVALEQDSKASITEFFFSEDNAAGFENFLTEAYAGMGAHLDLHRVQLKRGQETLVNNVNIYQKQSSLVNTFTFSLSGRMMRNNLNFLLQEENCESHLYGFYHVKGNDVIDNHTTVDHQQPHCFSNENYKGILDENGRGIFNGKIFVRPNAQKTNAFQSNKNIVLTDSAAINTKPQLEIWADDVKCSHGATTGQIDHEQMFYLRSRGLDERTARALLLHAFVFEIVEKIELDMVKEYLTKIINKQLGYHFDD